MKDKSLKDLRFMFVSCCFTLFSLIINMAAKVVEKNVTLNDYFVMPPVNDVIKNHEHNTGYQLTYYKLLLG